MRIVVEGLDKFTLSFPSSVNYIVDDRELNRALGFDRSRSSEVVLDVNGRERRIIAAAVVWTAGLGWCERRNCQLELYSRQCTLLATNAIVAL